MLKTKQHFQQNSNVLYNQKDKIYEIEITVQTY
jgi:hypothetical protein